MNYIPPFPRPKDVKKVKPAVKVMKDGREICDQLTAAGRAEYERRKFVMWERQGRICPHQISEQCKSRGGKWPKDEIVFGHESSRGFGGGTRDDRIEIDGKHHNYALCSFCNYAQGSKRISYSDAS